MFCLRVMVPEHTFAVRFAAEFAIESRAFNSTRETSLQCRMTIVLTVVVVDENMWYII